jgi:hypothetical protein
MTAGVHTRVVNGNVHTIQALLRATKASTGPDVNILGDGTVGKVLEQDLAAIERPLMH